MDDNIPDPEPVVFVPKRREDRDAWDKINAQLAALKTRMETLAKSAEADFNKWLATRTKTTPNSPLEDKAEIFYADAPLHFTKAPGVQIASTPKPADGEPIPELKDTSKEAPKLDPDKPFSISLAFYYPKAEQSYTIAAQNNSKDKNRGWVINITTRMLGMQMTGDGGKSIDIRAAHSQQLQHETWNTAVFTYDGSRHESGLNFYLNGQRVPLLSRGLNDPEIAGDLGTEQPLILGRSFPDGTISDFRVFNRVVTESEVRLLGGWPAIHSNDAPREALLTYFLTKQYEPYMALAKEQNDLNLKAAAISKRGAVTLVMEERTDAQPTAWGALSRLLRSAARGSWREYTSHPAADDFEHAAKPARSRAMALHQRQSDTRPPRGESHVVGDFRYRHREDGPKILAARASGPRILSCWTGSPSISVRAVGT